MYGTLDGSKTYHAARGNVAWAAADDPDLEIALLRGSEFVDQLYRSDFPGRKVEARDQVREWPRYDAFDVDGESIAPDVIPVEVVNATYEAALRELENPGALRPDHTPGRLVKSQRVEGAVSREFFPTDASTNALRLVVPIIGAILAPILTGEGSSSVLVGRGYRI